MKKLFASLLAFLPLYTIANITMPIVSIQKPQIIACPNFKQGDRVTIGKPYNNNWPMPVSSSEDITHAPEILYGATVSFDKHITYRPTKIVKSIYWYCVGLVLDDGKVVGGLALTSTYLNQIYKNCQDINNSTLICTDKPYHM